MRFKRWAWLPLVLVLPLLAVACGDDEGAGPSAPDITPEDLMSMAPTVEEVNNALLSMAPVEKTYQGSVSNEDEIERAVDPDDTRAAIETYGRITGLEASYLPEEGDEEILIQLELYETVKGASGLLRDVQDDPEVFGGMARFDAGDIGDEAEGRTGEPIPGVPATGILLRVDRVFAIVSVSLSDEDVRDEVRQLAEKVAEKIEATIQS